MIHSFRDTGTEEIFNGKSTKASRRVCPSNVWNIARRKLDLLDSAEALGDIRVPPGNRLETLSGSRKEQHSIRINQQYRVCFRWTNEGPGDVEITDYH